MKIIWCMFLEIWTATDIIFSHFGPFFALLPPNSLENQNFEKMKIMSIDTILLMCTINQNHMMYPFWHMECDRHKFFSFSAIFCPVTFLTAWKIKISKKWKTYPEISSFYTCAPKIMIRWRTVPEIWSVMDVIIFHFVMFFALIPSTARKFKILKWKKLLEIISFYTSVPKIMIICYAVP